MEQQNQNQSLITVEYAVSRQPVAYNNVRIGVTLPAMYNPERDLSVQVEELLNRAADAVHGRIDAEFESFDEVPPYSTEPRYWLAIFTDPKLVAIVPKTINKSDLPYAWSEATRTYVGHRWSYLEKVIDKDYADSSIFDCSDGDLSRLPVLIKYKVMFSSGSHNKHNLDWAILTQFDMDLTEELKKAYGYFNAWHFYFLEDQALAEFELKARKKGATQLFDIRDGDWSKLPPPPPPPTPPAAPDPDLEEEEIDDFEDDFEDEDGDYGDYEDEE